MRPVPILEFLLFLTSLLLEAAVVGMAAACCWGLYRLLKGLPLLPGGSFSTLPAARWGLGTVLLMVLLHLGAGSAAGVMCRELFGVDLKGLVAREQPEVPAVQDKEGADSLDVEHAEGPASASSARQLMIWNASYNVLFLMAFPWVFRRVSGAGAKDLGLSLDRWPEQLRVGVVAGLIAAPFVYAVQFLALMVFKVNAHPIERMLQDGFDPGTAALALFSTVILAPLTEEVMFRGVLQGWLTRAWSTWTISSSRLARFDRADRMQGKDILRPPIPDAHYSPESDSLRRVPNPVCWPAVILTSLLFAALHGPQWPAPIALFVFSVIMGAIYQRSGSLLTSIGIHGLFNGCSTLLLLTQQLSRSIQPPAPEVGAAGVAMATLWKSLVGIPS